jgi:putative DNA primase/helicase
MIISADEGRLILDEKGFVCRMAKKVARLQWANLANPSIDGRQAARHAIDSEKAAGIAAMMKLAQTEPGISIVNADLDRDILLLNTLDGVIDLRTGKLRERRPDDLLSKLAPIHFNATATAPRWDSFLSRIMAGNHTMIGYLQRLAGLCLSGLATTQELYILHGGGANGKSVFVDTLNGMMGDYSGLAPDSLLTARSQGAEHPTEIADLCGKRLVIGSETEEGAKLRVQLVKRLTGDATIKARYMRCDYHEFPRTHKLILVTNSRPRIGETTHAIWRRVRLIPFTVTIPPEEIDTELLVKLRAEWPGILNWAIKGFLDFQANGMQTPPEVMAATENYRAEQDPLAEYLSDRCIVDSAQRVSRNEIFADYAAWSKLAGDGTPDRASFYSKLRHVGGVDETKLRMQGRITRVFTGIGLANVGNQHRNSQERLAEME